MNIASSTLIDTFITTLLPHERHPLCQHIGVGLGRAPPLNPRRWNSRFPRLSSGDVTFTHDEDRRRAACLLVRPEVPPIEAHRGFADSFREIDFPLCFVVFFLRVSVPEISCFVASLQLEDSSCRLASGKCSSCRSFTNGRSEAGEPGFCGIGDDGITYNFFLVIL